MNGNLTRSEILDSLSMSNTVDVVKWRKELQSLVRNGKSTSARSTLETLDLAVNQKTAPAPTFNDLPLFEGLS